MLNKRILVLMFLLVFIPLALVGCSPPNQAPILTSDPITTATVGVEYTYDVNATDPDGDTLTYSLATPAGMTINSANGLIKWTPTAKGNYAVTVKVSDGDLDVIQSFTIVVTEPPNQSPIASFTASPTSGVAPLEVSFNASYSSDSDGNIVSYEWDFKDGNTGNGKIVNHTFASAGSYNVKLTVIDNKGATDSTTKTITVTEPITEPVPLGTPLTKDGITVTVERIELIEPPLCGQAFEVEIYFSVINNSESTLRGPGRFDYVLDEKIYEDEFNSIGYLHIGDGISWIYPGQSRSVGYNYCFHSPVTINRFTWGASFEDYSQIELGPWEN